MAPLFFGLNSYSDMPGQKQALLQEMRRCRHGLPSVESEWFLETVRQSWSKLKYWLGCAPSRYFLWPRPLLHRHHDLFCSIVILKTTERLGEWEN